MCPAKSDNSRYTINDEYDATMTAAKAVVTALIAGAYANFTACEISIRSYRSRICESTSSVSDKTF